MAGRAYSTEAVVLRSIRFGEADRVLHLYTEAHRRVGARAKGRGKDDAALRRGARAALAGRARPPSRTRRARDGYRGAARPVAPGGTRGLLPVLGRDDRRRGDAAPVQRGGGE